MEDKRVYHYKMKNFIFESYINSPSFSFKHTQQNHGTNVVSADQISTETIADAIIAHQYETIAIKTADCIPLALWNETSYALVHLGWRGLAKNLLEMNKDRWPAFTHALIGPSIRQEAFEVSESFSKEFPNSLDLMNVKNNTFTFNLAQECQRQINRIFGSIEVIDCGICTFSHLELPSYRRDKTSTRLFNVIRRIRS